MSTSVVLPVNRTEGFRDKYGRLHLPKNRAEKKTYAFDLTDELARLGTTISSVSWESGGPTLSAETNTTTSFTVTVLNTGYATATLTLASGEIIVRKFVFDGIDYTDYAYTA